VGVEKHSGEVAAAVRDLLGVRWARGAASAAQGRCVSAAMNGV